MSKYLEQSFQQIDQENTEAVIEKTWASLQEKAPTISLYFFTVAAGMVLGISELAQQNKQVDLLLPLLAQDSVMLLKLPMKQLM